MRINSGGINTVNVIPDALMAVMRIARGTDSGSDACHGGLLGGKRASVSL